MDPKKKAKREWALFLSLSGVVSVILAPGLPLLVKSERLRDVAPGIERSMEGVVHAISGKKLVCVAEPEFSEKTRTIECAKNEPVPGTVTSCELGIPADTFDRWSGGLVSGKYSDVLFTDSDFPPTNGMRELQANASGFGHNLTVWLTVCDDGKITAAEHRDLDEARHEMETDLRDFQAALAEHELWAGRIKFFLRVVVFLQVGLIASFATIRARRAMRERASSDAPAHDRS